MLKKFISLLTVSFLLSGCTGLKSDYRALKRKLSRAKKVKQVKYKPTSFKKDFQGAKYATCNISSKTKKSLIKAGVSKKMLNQFEKSIKGKKCRVDHNNHVLIDFNKSIKSNRLYVISLNDGGSLVYKTKVSHGKKSGNKYATKFSNKPGSNKTSLGLYKITSREKRTTGKFSIIVSGLDKKRNSNAHGRLITMHRAWYMNGRTGRSLGCFALSDKSLYKIGDINVLGNYLYAYHKTL